MLSSSCSLTLIKLKLCWWKLFAPRVEIDATDRGTHLVRHIMNIALASDQSDAAVEFSFCQLTLNDVANIGNVSSITLWNLFPLKLISLTEVGPISGYRNVFLHLTHIDTFIPSVSKLSFAEISLITETFIVGLNLVYELSFLIFLKLSPFGRCFFPIGFKLLGKDIRFMWFALIQFFHIFVERDDYRQFFLLFWFFFLFGFIF